MRGYVNKYADYRFSDFGGVENCDYCDNFTHCNEWNTPDNAVHFVCNNCEIKLRFPEKA